MARAGVRAAWAGIALGLAVACTSPKQAPDAGTSAWRVVLDELPGTLLSAWESSDGVLYAVGGDSTHALVLRHDADGWWQMDPGTSQTLWWVHGFSADDVFAVGAQGVVTHFDGTRWRVEREGGDFTLFGAWGATADDLVAVGGNVTTSAPRPVMVARSSGWAEVSTAALAPNRAWFKVWGRGPGDLFVVGDHGVAGRGPPGALVEDPALTTERLTTVHGAGSTVYAVGGLQAPVMLRFDGTKWHSVAVPGTPQLLNGVAVNDGGRAVIVGLDGYLAEGSGETFEEQRALTTRGLHGAAVTHEGFVAVGGQLLGSFGHGVLLARGKLESGSVRPWPNSGVRYDAGMPVSDAGSDGGSDAGVLDAGLDAGSDAGPDDAGSGDAGIDAGPDDAGSDAGSDAGVPDGGWLGPGDSCDKAPTDCAPGLSCWLVFGPFKNFCGATCADVSECGAYGPGACCRLPGPQVTEPVCLPASTGICDGGS